MWIVLDLIIVAIIAIFAILSAKRGFARTVIELVGYFLAIYLAFTIGGLLANLIYNKAVEPAVVETVSEKLTISANTNVDETVNKVWESLPDFVVGLAENFDLTKESIRETIVSNYTNTANTETFAKAAAEKVAEPIIIPLIKAILSLLLFIIFMLIIKPLAKIINKAFELPVIGGINKLLGFIIGFFKGAIISIIFVVVVLFIMSFFEDGFLIFTNENIEQTILFKFLAGFSPFN